MLEYDFQWSILWMHPYGGWMLQGIFTTIHLSGIGWIIALILGVVVGTSRVFPVAFIRFPGTAYVELFRNIPLLVQLFIWYFAVPLVLPHTARLWMYENVPNVEYMAALAALSIYTSSRVGEQIRSGLQSIPKEQYQAALSTGLSQIQMYRYVVIPYAARIIIPPLTGEFIGIFKNSSLALTIAVSEVTFMSQRIDSYTFHGIEAVMGASGVYIIICLTIMFFMGFIESRVSVPGLIKR